MAFFTHQQAAALGFSAIGSNVLISDRASIYGASRISIGDDVRIDDFAILSAGDGGISIGRHVHIACFVSLIGRGRITIDDYAGVSSRVAIYSSNDDYSGFAMTGPTLPTEFTNVHHAPVHLGRHAVIGAGSVILPGVTVFEGAVVGALSLVTSDCSSFTISRGVPAKQIGIRSKILLRRQAEFENCDAV